MSTRRQERFDVTLQSAAASGNGTAYEVNGIVEDLVIYAVWSAGGSGGVLSIEEATTDDYAGTWSVITTVTQAGASQTDAVHLSGAFKAIRARLSTGVTGGTVTVTMFGAQ